MTRAIINNQMHCKFCNRWLTRDKFSVDRSRPLGYRNYCKTCVRQHWPANKAKVKLYNDQYFADPIRREARRVLARDWARKHPDRMREMDRIYRAEHKEALAQKRTLWAEANPDKIAGYNARAYAKRKARLAAERVNTP